MSNLLESAKYVVEHKCFVTIDHEGKRVPTPDSIYEFSEVDEVCGTDAPDDLEGLLVLDMVTANLVVTLCDRLSQENTAKLLAMDPARAVGVLWRLYERVSA